MFKNAFTFTLLGLFVCGLSFSQASNSTDQHIDASKSSDIEWIKQLIAEKGDKKPENSTDQLIVATKSGDIELVQQLIAVEGNLDLNKRSGYKTPLITALYYDQVEILRVFLDNGADPNLVSGPSNFHPLEFAIRKGSAEMAELLINYGAQVDFRSGYGETLLFHAVLPNDAGVAKVLLESGADVNATSFCGFTPLMYASLMGNEPLMEALFEGGANVNIKTPHGIQALHIAARGGFDLHIELDDCVSRDLMKGRSNEVYFSIAKFLLENSANINAKDGDGKTALMHTVTSRNEELLSFLLESGADPNIRDKAGKTALMYSAGTNINSRFLSNFKKRQPQLQIFRQLLKLGSDPNIVDNNGSTALDYAKKMDNYPAIELLEHSGVLKNALLSVSQLNIMMFEAAQNGDANILKSSLALGADVNASDADGDTALMLSAKVGHLASMEWLIKYGCDLWMTDSNGNTALMISVTGGKIEYAELMLDYMFKLDTKNNEGKTALALAAEKNDFELVTILVNKQANPNIPDNEGVSPLMRAVENSNPKMIAHLASAGASPNDVDNNGQSVLSRAVQSGDSALIYQVKALFGKGVRYLKPWPAGPKFLIDSLDIEQDTFLIMFRQDSKVRVRDGVLITLSNSKHEGELLEEIEKVFQEFEIVNIVGVDRETEAKNDAKQKENELKTRRRGYDKNSRCLVYVQHLSEEEKVSFVNSLLKLRIVRDVYIERKTVPY